MLNALRRRASNGDRAVDATPETAPPEAEAPTIGLALGGGAARGFAHIGVIKTLLARGLNFSVITGTSIGAVVGGCYATGYLDELEVWARKLTRRGVVGYLDLSFAGSGLIEGRRLSKRLEATLGSRRIDDLPLRFAAIATEIHTGHEVWLTRGRVVDALRASYALPGIFAPVHIGGRWLVDGALVNPVPVSAARALNCRMVIGVNLNADLLSRGATITGHGGEDYEPIDDMTVADAGWRGIISPERMLKRKFLGEKGRPGIPSIMVDAFNVMQDRITRARLAGDPADIMISPRLANVGMFDFHRAAEAIDLGAEAAERMADTIVEVTKTLA